MRGLFGKQRLITVGVTLAILVAINKIEALEDVKEFLFD